MQFGRLIVISKTDKRQNRKVVWECLCECGNIIYAVGGNLLNGSIKSCGCLQREIAQQKFNDLTGRRFGKLYVMHMIDQRDNTFIMWKCRCDCGNIVSVRGSSLTSGATKSCGDRRCKKITKVG